MAKQKDRKDVELKETQGHRKFREYLEDLRRNKHFLKKVENIRAKSKKDPSKKQNECMGRLADLVAYDYKEWTDKFKKESAFLNAIDANDLTNSLKEYGVTSDIFSELVLSFFLKDKNLELSPMVDFCMINNNEEQYLNEEFNYIPIQLDPRKHDYFDVYPVSIDIHRFASKRDILDFIEKRWPIIEYNLDRESQVRFRKRKISRELSDFIWEKRDLNKKDLIGLLNEQFPQHNLEYFEIYKIISLEKQRRSQKLA